MQSQFSRTQMLFGNLAIDTLEGSRVAVFGLGGVGGHVVEVLARSGIGELDLIDNDRVSITNLNRQIFALHSTIGRYKVDVAAERVIDINPCCIVHKYQMFYLPENADLIDLSRFDYVVDCIDTVTAKLELIKRCNEHKIRIISSMGAANKLDPTAFRIADITKTKMDPLAKVIRKKLKKLHINKLKVVYSEEEPLKPMTIEESYKDSPSDKKNDDVLNEPVKKVVPASNAFVPAAAGLILGGEVVKDLLKQTHTLRLTNDNSEDYEHIIQARQKASSHQEKYDAIMHAKEQGIWRDDTLVVPLE